MKNARIGLIAGTLCLLATTVFAQPVTTDCPPNPHPIFGAQEVAYRQGDCSVALGDLASGEFRSAVLSLPAGIHGEHCRPQTIDHLRVSNGGPDSGAVPGLVTALGGLTPTEMSVSAFNASAVPVSDVWITIRWACGRD